MAPAVLVAVALAGFGAGHLFRSSSGRMEDRAATAKIADAKRPASPARAPDESRVPALSGSIAWAEKKFDRPDLRGVRLRMAVARECCVMDAAAAERAVKECGALVGVDVFSGSWIPGHELSDEITLQALARLSDLDPQRAVDLLKDSGPLASGPERVATVLAPFVATDMDQVVAVLGGVEEARRDAVELLLATPALAADPQACLKLLGICDDDHDLFYEVLHTAKQKDPELVRQTLARLVLAAGPETMDWLPDHALPAAFDSAGQLKDWALSRQGPGAETIHSFAISALIAGDPKEGHPQAAAELFAATSGSTPVEKRSDLAEQVGGALGGADPDAAETWATSMETGPIREQALAGIFEGRLDILEKNDNRRHEILPDNPGDTAANRDPGYWLDLMAPSQDRDGYVSMFVEQLRNLHHAQALAWLEKIADPALKERERRLISDGE